MSRAPLIVTLCWMLSVSSALAEPLAAGKPAGIRQAQASRYYGAVAIGALAVIAIAGYAISAKPYHIPGSPTAAAASSTQP